MYTSSPKGGDIIIYEGEKDNYPLVVALEFRRRFLQKL